jgi:tripartite-type tricarboxylate transporter receptor subunit TctC
MRVATLCASMLFGFYVTQGAAQAQNYPIRPVRMIVANGPGSAPDVIARLDTPCFSAR